MSLYSASMGTGTRHGAERLIDEGESPLRVRLSNLVGKTVETVGGQKHVLKAIAGSNAQGAVYEVRSNDVLVKIYRPSGSEATDANLLERLKVIAGLEVPDIFVGVEDVIASPFIGYVIKKAEEYCPLDVLLTPESSVSVSEWYNNACSLRDRLLIGCAIADAFRELEESGLFFSCISPRNILVKMGERPTVRITGIDNIYIAGRGTIEPSAAADYSAPELLGRVKNPSVLSNSYLLAAILYELLSLGRYRTCEDSSSFELDGVVIEASERLGHLTGGSVWPAIPLRVAFAPKLEALFTQCFIEGERNRMRRPSAFEFELALLDASNHVAQCSACGCWHYTYKEAGFDGWCPWCGSQVSSVATLEFFECVTEGAEYKTSSLLSEKHSNEYMLREGENRIPVLYWLGSCSPSSYRELLEEGFIVEKDSKGCRVVNESDRKDLLYAAHRLHKGTRLDRGQSKALNRGDRLFLGDPVPITIEGKEYFYIVVAKFDEVS